MELVFTHLLEVDENVVEAQEVIFCNLNEFMAFMVKCALAEESAPSALFSANFRPENLKFCPLGVCSTMVGDK